MTREPIDQRLALRLQLAIIAGNAPATSLLEIRSKRDAGGMTQMWVGVREVGRAITAIRNRAQMGDTYVGAAPRVREAGGLDAIEAVWTLWADCDTPEAVEALRKFRPLPSLVVRSGTGENVHAYWQLDRRLAPGQAARANRRLARALGADRAACDAARILRPVGSRNWKHQPAAAVEAVYLEPVAYSLADVVGPIEDDPADLPRPVTALRSGVASPAALAGLARVVAEAPEGERNHRLNWAAFKAGDHVAAGAFDRDHVEGELLDAALRAGLAEREALRTIQSGLDGRRAAA